MPSEFVPAVAGCCSTLGCCYCCGDALQPRLAGTCGPACGQARPGFRTTLTLCCRPPRPCTHVRSGRLASWRACLPPPPLRASWACRPCPPAPHPARRPTALPSARAPRRSHVPRRLLGCAALRARPSALAAGWCSLQTASGSCPPASWWTPRPSQSSRCGRPAAGLLVRVARPRALLNLQSALAERQHSSWK